MENKRLLFIKNTTAKRHPVVSPYIKRVMEEQSMHCFDTALYNEQKKYFAMKGFECPVLLEEHKALEQSIRRSS